MKKKHLIYILIVMISSCTVTKFELDPFRIEPKGFCAVSAWNSSNDKNEDIKNLREDFNCQTTYHIRKNEYTFMIMYCEDTVVVNVSKLHIPSNLEYVRILIEDTQDSSSLSVYPETSIAFHGQMIVANKNNKMCNMETTRPVNVSVYLISDLWKDNVNKDMREYEKKSYMDSLWRIIKIE